MKYLIQIFFSNLEEQMSQLEQLVNENKNRETLLNQFDPITISHNRSILKTDALDLIEPSSKQYKLPISSIFNQSNPTTYVDTRSTLDKCLDEILKAEALDEILNQSIESNFDTSIHSMDPIQIDNSQTTYCIEEQVSDSLIAFLNLLVSDPIPNQTPESYHFHQVNQDFIP